MESSRLGRRLALFAGGSAVIAMATLTAGCGGSESPSPSSTTTTTTSVTPSPTEKSLTPGGPNSFTPPVKAPPAPTGEPGTHRNGSSS
ncbi:hypothetical protein [Mycolicibacterium sp.]|uniref:hypothetical protein n=1 Tax=Mycolicibacterium sp. TaxID=2320850 RepID=UPI001A3005AD|nr:hypothetical protein [Mycolicibacterium sp.]MBJ7340899.1 hypothetical protein [Mycolicibacterium sp.]